MNTTQQAKPVTRETPETDAVTDKAYNFLNDGDIDAVAADFARTLERQRDEARKESAMWRQHIKTCLTYPRGSEAQVRCLEEVGQDAEFYEKQAHAAITGGKE